MMSLFKDKEHSVFPLEKRFNALNECVETLGANLEKQNDWIERLVTEYLSGQGWIDAFDNAVKPEHGQLYMTKFFHDGPSDQHFSRFFNPPDGYVLRRGVFYSAEEPFFDPYQTKIQNVRFWKAAK